MQTRCSKVRFPIGQLEYAGSREKILLAEAAKDYPVDTDSLLVLHSVENYSDVKLLDIGIRIAAVALVPVLLLGGWLVVALSRKKGGVPQTMNYV